ncbi:MAG: maleylpyruvate isomerase N-terminal domain-containing protein [Rhodococcus sp. (in: high G+C Gram-positive bacteria)]
MRADLDQIIATLSLEEWEMESACAGWRVRDVIAHLAANAHQAVDPIPEPPGAAPLPANRERQHDVRVDRRRANSVAEILDEYHTYVPLFEAKLLEQQQEPTASSPVSLGQLGTYPAHALANAQVFDYFCHLRHDLLQPYGPIDQTTAGRSLGEVSHAALYAAVQWMMWGLPQMQGSDLDDTVTEPVTFEFTGAGASTWTVTRGSDGLVVTEDDAGAVRVVSDAAAFVAWGTTRQPWAQHCKIEGDQNLAVPLLDALDIV